MQCEKVILNNILLYNNEKVNIYIHIHIYIEQQKVKLTHFIKSKIDYNQISYIYKLYSIHANDVLIQMSQNMLFI